MIRLAIFINFRADFESKVKLNSELEITINNHGLMIIVFILFYDTVRLYLKLLN